MDKSDLRIRLLAARADIRERKAKDAAICARASKLASDYAVVFSYLSMGSEADTRGLIRRLTEQGKTVYIPYALSNGVTMHAVPLPRVWDRKTDKLGNLPHVDLSRICDGLADLAIVPLLGFNAANYRIGYGKGYYDRHFMQNPNGYKVGLAYDEQFCSFAPQDTDAPLDCIITPTRVIRR